MQIYETCNLPNHRINNGRIREGQSRQGYGSLLLRRFEHRIYYWVDAIMKVKIVLVGGRTMYGDIPIDWESYDFVDFTQPGGKLVKLSKAIIAMVSEDEEEE